MDAAADFVQRFTAFWADPSADRMSEILLPEVILVQPMSRRMQGLDAAQAEFRKLFAWLPDLRAEIDDWAARGSTLYIQFRLSATIGGRRVEWRAVDRFELRGNMALSRVSYFDSLPLFLRVLTAPTAWPGWWHSGVARPWARG